MVGKNRINYPSAASRNVPRKLDDGLISYRRNVGSGALPQALRQRHPPAQHALNFLNELHGAVADMEVPRRPIASEAGATHRGKACALSAVFLMAHFSAAHSAISAAHREKQWWDSNEALLRGEQCGARDAQGSSDMTQRAPEATEANVAPMPTRAMAPASAPMSAIMPVKRSAPLALPPTSTGLLTMERRPQLGGDLPVGRNSLVCARIMAVRNMLGENGEGREDEELLDIANQIHRHALAGTEDRQAMEASLALFREEAEIWASENGAASILVTSERKMEAYREAWSLALDPPPLPQFKSRSEIAHDYVKNSPEQIYRRLTLEAQGLRDGGVNVDQEATAAYFNQFIEYVSTHLPRLCAAKAIANAKEVGLERLEMEFRPRSAWIIDKIVLQTISGTAHDWIWAEDLMKDRMMPVIAFPLPGNHIGLVGPSGELRLLHKSIRRRDGALQTAPILNALGLQEMSKRASQIDITSEFVEISGPRLSIKEIMENKIRQNINDYFARLRSELYDPTIIQKLLKVIAPFYDTVHRVQNDPLHEVVAGDVAWDLLSLGMTLASIGASPLSVQALRAGVAAAKSLPGASAAVRASAAIRASMASVKTSTVLRVVGRELTDFVLPVFTAKDLVKVAGRGGSAIAQGALRAAARQLDTAVASVASDGATLLDRIYDSLYRTQEFWWIKIADEIKAEIDLGARKAIPPVLFRGQTVMGTQDFLRSKWVIDSPAARDEYLAAIIRHSSRTSGSAGEVLSLSTEQDVARGFASGRSDARVFVIDTQQDPENFRTIEHIIKYDGPRLVAEGKISTATLAAAIKHTIHQSEGEVFYMLGGIPDRFLKPSGQALV